MDKNDFVKQYEKDGFIRIDGLFSREEMRLVNQAFLEAIQSPVPGMGVIKEDSDADVVRSVMGWQHAGGVLDRFAREERILEVVKTLLGDEQVEFHQTKFNPKAPGLKGEKWDPHRGDTFWCFKDGVPNPDKMMSVFIAITDQTPENGAVFAWKGSHVVTLDEMKSRMTGLEEEGSLSKDTSSYLSLQIKPEVLEEFNTRFERLMFEGAAGTVWFLSSSLLHASQANQSNETRSLVANVFRTQDNRPTHPRSQSYLSEPGQIALQSEKL